MAAAHMPGMTTTDQQGNLHAPNGQFTGKFNSPAPEGLILSHVRPLDERMVSALAAYDDTVADYQAAQSDDGDTDGRDYEDYEDAMLAAAHRFADLIREATAHHVSTEKPGSSAQVFALKRAAAKAAREADRLGVRLIAADIKRAVPNAAYLEMSQSNQSVTHGFNVDRILDAQKNSIGSVEEDTMYLDDGTEAGIDGDLLWGVLSDLPQDIPVEYDQATGLSSYAPEYAWMSEGSQAYTAIIDLNKAVAD